MPQDTSSQPPHDRDRLLEIAGLYRAKIYRMVRSTLDEIEGVSPWDSLYYPPEDPGRFLSIIDALVKVIEDSPQRVEETIQSLSPEGASNPGEVAPEDARFFFDGIHMMIGPDLHRLRQKHQRFASEPESLSEEERDAVCELAADIKGKYASALMGASASLLAEGRWDGVEVEPILFPEKAAEFGRNERLVETLRQVLEALRRLPQEVPLPKLVARWQQEQRVDQYALTPFYSYLGVLGQLMKEESRRALYSGDYHQIKKRERMLSARVNELNILHNTTWGTDPGDRGKLRQTYTGMVQKATEIAAILDVDVLRQIVGQNWVHELHAIVEQQGDRRSSAPALAKLPDALRSLVPLLQEEDLKTFFELLLGSVLKRASLAYGLRAEAPDTPPPPELPEVETGSTIFDEPTPPPKLGDPLEAPAPQATASPLERRETLQALQELLEELLSPANSQRKAFDFFHRFLTRNRTLPPGMMQTILPFLGNVSDRLLPLVERAAELGDLPTKTARQLEGCCTALRQAKPDPASLHQEVPAQMDRIVRVLDGLKAATEARLADPAAQLPTHAQGGRLG